jgi:PRTRC genetic system protein A
MIPIYFKNEQFEEPAGAAAYFLLAGNGVFLVKDMDLYRACVQVEGAPWHRPQSEYLELKCPKIPVDLVEACMGFFYEVYDAHESESIVLLYFSPAVGEFRVEVPRQQAPRRSRRRSHFVHYEIPPAPEGFVRLGDWHSHADLRACHSEQDDADECTQDGLHIVVGDLDMRRPSFSFSFVVNGRRFAVTGEDVLEGYRRPKFPVPKEWLNQVEYIEDES